MTSETLPAAKPAGRWRYVRYSPSVVRELLMRVTNGESVEAICRDRWMPYKGTVTEWAKNGPGSPSG